MILTVKSKKTTEFLDITSKIQEMTASSGIVDGTCMLFVPHTTAAITINESADPSVKSDIMMILNKIVPWEDAYRHLEGNSPAHVKSSLVGASEWIAVENGRLALGTCQGIFFCELDGPRNRRVRVTFVHTPS